MAFAKFMASGIGRIVRIVAGIALIAAGLLLVQDVGGIIMAVVGLVPLLAGVFNVCVIAPVLGGPFNGSKIAQG